MAEEFEFAYVSKKRGFLWIVTAIAVAAVGFYPYLTYVVVALIGIWFSEFRFIKNHELGVETWMWVLPIGLLVGDVAALVYFTSLPLAVVRGSDPTLNPWLSLLAIFVFLAQPAIFFFGGFLGSRLAIRKARKNQIVAD